MIEGIFILNNKGNLRFIKIYSEEENNFDRGVLIKRIYNSVKDANDINIVLDFEYLGNNKKLVFKKYGMIYICIILDDSENELAILDFISVIINCFDEIFNGVCELHLIMNPEKLYFLLDEMISGGIIMETSKDEIVQKFNEKLKD